VRWRVGSSSVVDSPPAPAQATRFAGGASQNDDLQAGHAGSPESGSRIPGCSMGGILIAAIENKNAVDGT
jgi:hypothetical protein